jgi:hypothetical protein
MRRRIIVYNDGVTHTIDWRDGGPGSGPGGSNHQVFLEKGDPRKAASENEKRMLGGKPPSKVPAFKADPERLRKAQEQAEATRRLMGHDKTLGEKTEVVRKIINRFILGALSRSEALQTLMTEGFSGQTAARIIAANASKLFQHDGVGTSEEVAYGEGWHSVSSSNPYDDPVLKAAWEKGRAARKQKQKMNTNYRRGETRGKQFEPPRQRSQDSLSERDLRDAKKRVAELEQQLREARERKRQHIQLQLESAKKWLAKLQSPPQKDSAGDEIRYGGCVIRETNDHGESIFTVFGSKTPSGGRSYLGDFSTLSSAKQFIDRRNKNTSRDYKSEKGYVARLVDATTGAVLARSEPHISNGVGLKSWIQKEAHQLIQRGKRVKAEIVVVFFDPNMA